MYVYVLILTPFRFISNTNQDNYFHAVSLLELKYERVIFYFYKQIMNILVNSVKRTRCSTVVHQIYVCECVAEFSSAFKLHNSASYY